MADVIWLTGGGYTGEFRRKALAEEKKTKAKANAEAKADAKAEADAKNVNKEPGEPGSNYGENTEADDAKESD